MPDTQEKLQALLGRLGASRSAPIAPRDIPFDDTALASCKMNQCGCYGKRWSCPPAVAPRKTWEKRLFAFESALVFQAEYPFADIFDYAAMEAGAQHFYALCRQAETQGREISTDCLVLGAGACRECRRCTYPSAPCVRSEGPVLSMEACGINVTRLCEKANLPYNASETSVTYTGLLLF